MIGFALAMLVVAIVAAVIVRRWSGPAYLTAKEIADRRPSVEIGIHEPPR